MAKIGIARLKEIIQEEIENMSLQEGADHDTATKIMSSASKLLKAIEAFKDTGSEKLKSEVGESVDNLEKILNRVVASPMQYIDTVKPTKVKKVSLRSTPKQTL